MRTLTQSLFLLAVLSLVACGRNAPTASEEPTSLSPAQSAPGRTETVIVDGLSGVSGGTSVSVDFGPGIDVTAVAIADGVVAATLTIDRSAFLGARDVRVTQGGTTISLPAAFRVSPPFTATVAPTGARSIGAGERRTVLLAGLATHWWSGTVVSAPAGFAVESVTVQGGDSIALELHTDLFAATGEVAIVVDGEENPAALSIEAAEIEQVGPTGDATGDLPAGAVRVWHLPAGAGEAVYLTASAPNGTIELHDDGDGLSAGTLLGAHAETALPGRPTWLVARGGQEDGTFSASWRTAFATDLGYASAPSQSVVAPGSAAVFRIGHVAPWCLVELSVTPTSSTGVVALTSRQASWATTRVEGASGAVIRPRAVVGSLGDALWFVVPSGPSGETLQVAASAVPFADPAMLFPRNGLGKPVVSGMSAVDAIEVPWIEPDQIGSVHVGLALRHPVRGALSVTLTSPSGTTVSVVAPDPSAQGADLVTVLPDLTVPAESLDALLAGVEDVQGSWTLTVSADGFEEGVLDGWALGFGPATAAPATSAPATSAPATSDPAVEATPIAVEPCYAP